jgi:RNA polymerase sigma-70 factor, ECF subfamily
MALLEKAKCEGWTDEEVVDRVQAGETALYEIIMRRYNRHLYRVVRAILLDDGETEDVMQDAYVRAYRHLGQFEKRAPLSTWLTRIAVHEALARLRRRKPHGTTRPQSGRGISRQSFRLGSRLRAEQFANET